MSEKQLKNVVRAGASAYAITGSIAGGDLGLLLHWFFFGMLITENWGQLWEPPILVLIVVQLTGLEPMTSCVGVWHSI